MNKLTLTDVRTLGDIPRVQARLKPDAVALVCRDRVTTYAQFDHQVNQVANGLLALGLEPQTRVAYLGKNSDRFLEILMATAKAGMVTVGLNWRLAPAEVTYVVKDAQAKVMFIAPEFVPIIEEIRNELAIEHFILLEDEPQAAWPDYAAWRDPQEAHDPNCPVDPHDIVIQLYTSGTTGYPKGVQLHHDAFLGMDRHVALDDPSMRWYHWGDDDVNLCAMPLFHIGGTHWSVHGLLYGVKNIVVEAFSAVQTLDLMANHGITKLFMVPATIQQLLNAPGCRNTDFSTLKTVMYGASPIPLALLSEAIDVLQCQFVQLYGMTETAGAATYLPAEDHDVAGNQRMRSAGKPYGGVNIKIIDDHQQPLPPHEVGQICIASAGNMKGYWQRPDATAETLIDGYVLTGDAGYLDEDGYVYVHDRVKEMIVSGGENIYPAEVENAIFGLEGVDDVAVIGVPDEKWGEAVKAMIKRKPNAKLTANEVMLHARSKIAGYKVPKSVDFVDEIPRNPSGKLLRRQLRAPFWANRERQVN